MKVLSARQSLEPVADSVRIVSLSTNDIVYHPANERIYASVPGSAGAGGNSVITLDPKTAIVGSSIFVGSEPSKLAFTSDYQKLYINLVGAYAVGRLDLASGIVESRFKVGYEPGDGLRVGNDIAVAPGNNNLVAVARKELNVFPPQAGVAIFENGVRLPQTAPGHSEGSHYVAFGSSDAVLFGSNEYGIKKMTVTTSGVSVPANNRETSPGGYGRFKVINGIIYSANGQVLDASTNLLGTFPIGTFPNNTTDAFVADPGVGRAYYLTRNVGSENTWTLRAYNTATFLEVGNLVISNVQGNPTSMIRWGSNGLAFRTDAGQLFLIQTALIPTDQPLPTPPPVPPTPTPPNFPTYLRRIDVPTNDMAYDHQTNSVLVTVPGTAEGGIGNSITHLNPETETITSSVFIGSEPKMIAPAGDAQTLYVTLDGANSIRRYDIPNQAPGAQFSIPQRFWRPDDIAVMPGRAETIALSGGIDGAAIFDNGKMRPNTFNLSVNSVAFSSADPNTLYGYENGSSLFNLSKIIAGPNGLSGSNIGPGIFYGHQTTIKHMNGLLYATDGIVVDPETVTVAGTFGSGGDAMCIDEANDRVFFLEGSVLSAFDIETFAKIGSVTLPPMDGTPMSMERWGTNGIVFRTFGYSNSAFNPIYLVRSSLVSSNGPVPNSIQFGDRQNEIFEQFTSAYIRVNRSGDTSLAQTVSYQTTDGTAIGGTDFTPQSGTLVFAPGEVSKYIAIPITADALDEQNETFTLSLSSPGNGATIIAPSSITVTIGDDDPEPIAFGLAATVEEPRVTNSRTIEVQVQLFPQSGKTVTMDYATANGTAVAGIDYLATSGTLTFNPLETVKSFPVQILQDRVAEGNENFAVILSNPSNASIAGSAAVTILDRTPVSKPFDYDRDGRADLSVRRPSDNIWYLLRGTAGFTAITWGEAGDRMAPADYDGDGRTDVAVFRPSTGQWFVVNSSNLTFVTYNWGQAGDLPVPTDRDNDGRSDLVLFRPSNNTWYPRSTATGPLTPTQFGEAGDKPMVGDFDADGIGDIALFRPSNNNWYIIKSSLGFFVQTWGEAGDIPTTGDFDGDGATDQAVFRPSAGQWFLSRTTAGFSSQFWGQAGDIPVAADYDGDGRTDVAVFRPSNATWYIVQSTAGILIQQFGQTGDVPTQSSYLY